MERTVFQAYLTHTSDSLIKQVLSYYEGEKDKERLYTCFNFAQKKVFKLNNNIKDLLFMKKNYF